MVSFFKNFLAFLLIKCENNCVRCKYLQNSKLLQAQAVQWAVAGLGQKEREK